MNRENDCREYGHNIGIHWHDLDEDISFDSFLYPDAEPTRLQRFFLTHPEINVSGFAQKFGFSASLMRSLAKERGL